MNPKISIIIVNWNGQAYLEKCLSLVVKQSYDNYNVIVVDNGSIDNSVSFLKKNYSEVKIIYLEKNYGFAEANNIGIRKALDEGAELIALLNNDVEVKLDWLEELAKAIRLDNCIGSCQSKILSWHDRTLIDAVGMAITKRGDAIQVGNNRIDMGQYDMPKEVFGACAGAVLYKGEMLKEIGLFDDIFFAYFEDVDLALRARLMGWKCIYVPEAICYHMHSGTLGEDSSFRRYLLERNKYYYIIKNLPLNTVFKFLINQTVGMVKTLMVGKRKDRLAYMRANFDAIKNIPKVFKKRVQVRFLANLSDRELKKWFI